MTCGMSSMVVLTENEMGQSRRKGTEWRETELQIRATVLSGPTTLTKLPGLWTSGPMPTETVEVLAAHMHKWSLSPRSDAETYVDLARTQLRPRFVTRPPMSRTTVALEFP